MSFLTQRPRRLRANSAWRGMVAETTLSARDFVYPLFVIDGENVVNPIASMPGVAQLSIDKLVEEVAPRARARRAGGDPVRHPRPQGRRGQPGLRSAGDRAARHPGVEARDSDASRLGRTSASASTPTTATAAC